MTGKTVLYVDDDLSRVERFGNLVKPDFDVETAFNGWDGVGASIMYHPDICLLYTSPSPRDRSISRMPSSA